MMSKLCFVVSKDYLPSIPFLGHMCLLMRFNELELHVWLLITLLTLVEPPASDQRLLNLKVPTLLELLLVTSTFVKFYLQSTAEESAEQT